MTATVTTSDRLEHARHKTERENTGVYIETDRNRFAHTHIHTHTYTHSQIHAEVHRCTRVCVCVSHLCMYIIETYTLKEPNGNTSLEQCK